MTDTDPRVEAFLDAWSQTPRWREWAPIKREMLKEDVSAALRAADAGAWQPIETAPRDGTLIWVYVAEAHDLPAFQSVCAWHNDAGWCCDELRPVTHWVPLRSVWKLPPAPGEG